MPATGEPFTLAEPKFKVRCIDGSLVMADRTSLLATSKLQAMLSQYMEEQAGESRVAARVAAAMEAGRAVAKEADIGSAMAMAMAKEAAKEADIGSSYKRKLDRNRITKELRQIAEEEQAAGGGSSSSDLRQPLPPPPQQLQPILASIADPISAQSQPKLVAVTAQTHPTATPFLDAPVIHAQAKAASLLGWAVGKGADWREQATELRQQVEEAAGQEQGGRGVIDVVVVGACGCILILSLPEAEAEEDVEMEAEAEEVAGSDSDDDTPYELHNGLVALEQHFRLSQRLWPCSGKWQTQTRINGRRYTFGRHDTAKEAAIAVAEGLKKFNAHIVPSRVGVLTYRQVRDGEPVPDGEIVDVDEEEREEDIGSSSAAAVVPPQ